MEIRKEVLIRRDLQDTAKWERQVQDSAYGFIRCVKTLLQEEKFGYAETMLEGTQGTGLWGRTLGAGGRPLVMPASLPWV